MKLNVRFLHIRGWPVAVRPAALLHGILTNTASCGRPGCRVWPPEDDSLVLRTFPAAVPVTLFNLATGQALSAAVRGRPIP